MPRLGEVGRRSRWEARIWVEEEAGRRVVVGVGGLEGLVDWYLFVW